MYTCCFFGHHDAPMTIRQPLQSAIQKLIVEHGVTQFYVGDKGAFERIVASVLREMKKDYPQINYKIVYVDEIPKTKNGKMKFIVSEV